MNNTIWIHKVLGWFFGMLFSAIGVINMFWGNDPFFGIFIFGLSLIFYPPLSELFRSITGYRIHFAVKILIGLFILWTSLGVGELFDKIHLMWSSFKA